MALVRGYVMLISSNKERGIIMNTELLDFYEEQGFKIIPLLKQGKAPRDKGWNKKEYTRLALEKNQDNWGVQCGDVSNLVVIDLDNHNENEELGVDALARLCKDQNKTLPETYTVQSPSGGIHHYFRMKDNQKHTARFHKNIEGYPQIDVQTNHKYVVGEGSSTDIGTYTQVSETRDIADLPAWLYKLIVAQRDHAKEKPRTLNALGSIIDNTTMWKDLDFDTWAELVLSDCINAAVKDTDAFVFLFMLNKNTYKKSKEELTNTVTKFYNGINILTERNPLNDFIRRVLEGAGEGQRNNYMNEMSGRILASGCSNKKGAYSLAKLVNHFACVPPMEQDEFFQTWNSTLRIELDREARIKKSLEGEENDGN